MSRMWAIIQMGLAPMLHSTGLRFYKLLGTGSDHGFTFNANPLTNTGVYAILCVWTDNAAAHEGILKLTIFSRYFLRSPKLDIIP